VSTPPPPRDPDWRPTPPEIEHAPEIALLSVLQRTLETSVYAILASHPYLADEPGYRQLHLPEVKAADAVLAHAHRPRDALDRYRRAIAELYARSTRDEADPPGAEDPNGHGGSDDIPF
jgi:hypothetical protein